MDDMLKGLLGKAMGGQGLPGLDMSQIIKQKDITIELTEDQFKQIALQGVDKSAHNRISVEFHEKKLIIKINLF